MHLSVNNRDTSTNILSFKELIAIVVVFSFTLYLLFPKKNIDLFINKQSEHTNLSINYLESMLLYYPDNIKLKMLLVKNYDYAGETNKALRLNQQIINATSDKKRLIELYKTQYLLEKENYFKREEKSELIRLKERLLDYYEYTKGQRDYLFFFAESTNISYTYLQYHSLVELMKEQPNLIDYELEKQAYYLASSLGYKERAYEWLVSLLKYPQIEEKLQLHALNSLLMHNEIKRVSQLAHDLFLKSTNKEKISQFFYIALYALSRQPNQQEKIKKLIDEFKEIKELTSSDIYTIIKTLLEQNLLQEASSYAIAFFRENPQAFNKKNIDLALQTLTYDSKLQEAREIGFFALEKFHQPNYLDKLIQLSLWLGDIEMANQLYKEGYREFKDKKYETYLLENASLDDAYDILGDIYKDKIEQGEYDFVDKLSSYYNYTGEIDKAEQYFTTLLKSIRNQKVHAAAVNFTLDNSHFKKAFKLYKSYHLNYRLNPELHEKVIKCLIAAKLFKDAYAFAKELNEANQLQEQRLFTDLAWILKDYRYLYKSLWSLEKKNSLNITGYEHLTLFEKSFNSGERLSYLYQRVWQKSHSQNQLLALLYSALENGDYSLFKSITAQLTTEQKAMLSSDINYQIALANYYAKVNKLNLALSAFNQALILEPNKSTTHQSYLWFLINNHTKDKKLIHAIKEELKRVENNQELQISVALPSVVAALLVKQNSLALRWSQKLLKLHPRNQEYQALYREVIARNRAKLLDEYEMMQNGFYLTDELQLTKETLSKRDEVVTQTFLHKWQISSSLTSYIKLQHYLYVTNNQTTQKESAFELALKNRKKRFLWELSLGVHNAKVNYFSSQIKLGYSLHKLQFNLNAEYQHKTNLTPKLQRDGVVNLVTTNLNYALSSRISLGFLFNKSYYYLQDKTYLGESQQLQLSANYTLRLGYPDITFGSYITQYQFSKNIAKDFSEVALSMRVGKHQENRLNYNWRPFGEVTVAINEQKNMGASFNLGLSKVLTKKDSLDILFNYSSGIGVIGDPIYGINVKYRF